MDGRANRGELKFNRRLAELLNASRACGTAITYESSSFSVPLHASRTRESSARVVNGDQCQCCRFGDLLSKTS